MFKKLFFFLTLALLPWLVMATGLSVSPAELNFEINREASASKILIVSNPTADVMVFEVYADEFQDAITINPESFTLESGGRKEVLVSINQKNLKESQKIATTLSVVGTPLAQSKVNIGAGAKIPLTASLNSEVNALPYQPYGLAVLGLIGIALLFYRNSRKLKSIK